MGKKNKWKHGLLALSAVFCQLAMPSGAAAQDGQGMAGVWENEDIGVVDVQPCEHNQSKFCGYLIDASPEAIEKFELRVNETSSNLRGMLVMTDLEPNEQGSKFSDGRFENTDRSRAQSAELTIKYDGQVMNVRASIGWFGESFSFKRVPEQLAGVQHVAKAPGNNS